MVSKKKKNTSYKKGQLKSHYPSPSYSDLA